ncbi:MAG: uracil-DNA glycosylase [Chloroflexi bacterium]|nr:uracil-DNA glycosylase [Chloroflexota bacterium]
MSEELTVIAQEVRSCTNCRLHEGTRNGVPGEGNPNAEILFVGEGPGFHEDAQGRPFVGPAGKLLNEMLERAGLSRDDVYITNVVKHRPPGNRDPMPDEIEACHGYLERQIAEIKPVLIVTLGRFSMATFFGPQARITQMHGRLRPWRDIAAYACFHPAAALRQPKYREGLEEDFDKLPRALEAARKRAREQAEARAAGTTGATAPGGTDPTQSGPSQMTLF